MTGVTDRKTVITDLQIIHTWAEFAIERDLQFFTKKHLENIAQWTDNALELVKEDCHNCKLECLLQKYDELKEKYDALLNEQKAVSVHDPGAYCPKCDWMLYPEDHPHHCGNCKLAVKLE